MKKVYGFLVWFIVTLFVVYAFSLNTAAAVFSNAIQKSLQVNSFQAAIGSGGFILGFACMQIPAGYFLDKYPLKSAVTLGIFLLTLGNILIYFSSNLVFFTLSNLIQGIGASFAFTAAAIVISQWFAAKSFPVLFGLTQTISCVMAAFLHYLFTLELNDHSWHYIYQKLAIFGIVITILTFLLVKSPADFHPQGNSSLSISLKAVLKNSQILLCCLAAACSFGTMLAYASFWFLPIQQFYQISYLNAIMISGSIFVGIGLGTPFWGWVSNKVKSRSIILHVTLVSGCMALLMGIYFPHYSIKTIAIITSFSFLIGFLLSGSMLYYTVVSESVTDAVRGVALSLTNTGVFLMNTLMLFIPYLFITKESTSFFTYLWIFPFLILLSILVNYFIRDTFNRGSSIK